MDTIYIDMAKYFDKGDHSILVAKLNDFGLWIPDYLKD